MIDITYAFSQSCKKNEVTEGAIISGFEHINKRGPWEQFLSTFDIERIRYKALLKLMPEDGFNLEGITLFRSLMCRNAYTSKLVFVNKDTMNYKRLSEDRFYGAYAHLTPDATILIPSTASGESGGGLSSYAIINYRWPKIYNVTPSSDEEAAFTKNVHTTLISAVLMSENLISNLSEIGKLAAFIKCVEVVNSVCGHDYLHAITNFSYKDISLQKEYSEFCIDKMFSIFDASSKQDYITEELIVMEVNRLVFERIYDLHANGDKESSDFINRFFDSLDGLAEIDRELRSLGRNEVAKEATTILKNFLTMLYDVNGFKEKHELKDEATIHDIDFRHLDTRSDIVVNFLPTKNAKFIQEEYLRGRRGDAIMALKAIDEAYKVDSCQVSPYSMNLSIVGLESPVILHSMIACVKSCMLEAPSCRDDRGMTL